MLQIVLETVFIDIMEGAVITGEDVEHAILQEFHQHPARAFIPEWGCADQAVGIGALEAVFIG